MLSCPIKNCRIFHRHRDQLGLTGCNLQKNNFNLLKQKGILVERSESHETQRQGQSARPEKDRIQDAEVGRGSQKQELFSGED